MAVPQGSGIRMAVLRLSGWQFLGCFDVHGHTLGIILSIYVSQVNVVRGKRLIMPLWGVPSLLIPNPFESER